MDTVVGIFTSLAAAERAIEGLRHNGIPVEHINCLTPRSSTHEVDAVPTVDAEPPGMGKVLGGIVGGATGASGGLLGASVASAVVPGVGPVIAIGLAAAALLGVGGAIAGSVAGDALENALSAGLPKDELFVYEDALRQGYTVLIVLTREAQQADMGREVLLQSGAESLDAARERWWLGLRDVEAEAYAAQGWDFMQDESLYRQGFEAALQTEASEKPGAEAVKFLHAYYNEVYREEAFRRGYARGRASIEGLREKFGR
jgi:hypothetical protein